MHVTTKWLKKEVLIKYHKHRTTIMVTHCQNNPCKGNKYENLPNMKYNQVVGSKTHIHTFLQT